MGKVIVFDRLDMDTPERVLSCRWWADWKEQQEYAEAERKVEDTVIWRQGYEGFTITMRRGVGYFDHIEVEPDDPPPICTDEQE